MNELVDTERNADPGGGGCTLAGPGRGDCEHFCGLPATEEYPRDVDEYGKPRDWCWACWKSELLRRVYNRRAKPEPSAGLGKGFGEWIAEYLNWRAGRGYYDQLVENDMEVAYNEGWSAGRAATSDEREEVSVDQARAAELEEGP